jgi:PPOX class probable F420-dependent enzyme
MERGGVMHRGASVSETSTINKPTIRWSPARPIDWGSRFVLIVTLLAGLFLTAAAVAALLAPNWFADVTGFPRHTHFVHDLGAFQLGIGASLLLAVVGEVTTAVVPALARFVRQKTVLVTTYRRNGRPVSTPVSLAVDGDHAYLRTFEKAGKTRRIHNNPRVDIAPCTARGRPTGPAIHATAWRLEGAEARRAARLLRHKQPLLHGVLVPLTHRLGRAKTGKTVHFKLIPDEPGQPGPENE